MKTTNPCKRSPGFRDHLLNLTSANMAELRLAKFMFELVQEEVERNEITFEFRLDRSKKSRQAMLLLGTDPSRL